MAETPEPNAVVSVESGGRTLSGAGVSSEQLQETINSHEERHAPAAKIVEAPPGTTTHEPAQLAKGRARYTELTAKAKAAEERATAVEKERDELKARLSQPPPQQPTQQPGPQPQQTPAQTPRAEMQYTRPEPSEDDIGDKYPTYAAFTRAQAEWVNEQNQTQINQLIRQGIEQDRAAQAFDRHVEATRAKGRAIYRDFDAMLTSGPGTFVDMPLPAVHAILNHPQSEHLQYKIMADGATAQRLAQIAFRDPYAFAFELAKLAPAEVLQNGNGRPQPAPPAPMTPVGSGSRTSVPSSAEHAERGDYPAYRAARAAERKGRE